ncbi:Inosine triphosphate pyrophosphatase [Penicillium rolfsii]|nr:Inosine triphosphate pyrophosphatase [Penicillium rolfsii]
MKQCTFVTGNPNKVIEVNAILGDSIPIRTLALEIPEIQGSLEDIARDKCRRAAKIVDGPVLVEDSALEFHAMNKLPGPYIKYFLEKLGNDGLNKLLFSFDDKRADAVCTFAFSSGPACEPLIFQGRLQVWTQYVGGSKWNRTLTGKIVPARGPPVFGWEPIFEHEGETLAEMAHDRKNKLSHRYQALCKFQKWLAKGEAPSSEG